jgi:hypothetical protein
MTEDGVPDDRLEHHCPRLGGAVTLDYCRRYASATPPCERIRDCWWQQCDIQRYLAHHFPPTIIARLERPATPSKLASLIEGINAARRNLGGEAPDAGDGLMSRGSRRRP